MIRKLRLRLIAASMLSLLAVLVVILGSVNLISYRRIVRDADAILSLLCANQGVFPMGEPLEEPPLRREPEADEDFHRLFSPELPYESRYFSAILSDEGEPVSVDTGKIAAVDTSVAMDYARQVWESGRERGFLQDYRYVRQETEKGTQIIFLDCGRSLDTFRGVLFTSCWISLAGLAAVLVLLVVLSTRIIRPVSESYEKQRQFITNAGHEIKTPLTIIGADADVLELEVGENQWLRDIQTQTRRLGKLTNDLIYLSRMEEADRRLRWVTFSLSDAAEEMVQSFQGLAAAQGKTLESRVAPMISLRGDEEAVGQLFSVLLDNAVKYAPQGGGIELRLEGQGRWIRLTVVNDTAQPVDREQLDRLFDRFYRGDASRNSRTGGYGIGLSIAAAVVAAHRGKISASVPEEGQLAITVQLPAGKG